MQNTLVEYLAQGNKMADLAAKAGVPPSTITRALRGERNPSLELARKIEAGTNGAVTAKDFMAACLDEVKKPKPTEAGEAA